MPAEGNLFETLAAAAGDASASPFLIEPDGETTTYGEVFARAAAMAAVLRDRGVEPGDRVVVTVEKSPAAVALYLACLHAGAVHVPLNPASTPDELDYFVTDATPRLVVDDAEPTTPGPTMSLDQLCSAAEHTIAAAPTPRDGNDLAALLYTSGTTGRPKGAALTHDNLRHNARALHETWRMRGDDHLLHILPIFHVHGLFVALHCAMLSAIPVTFLRRFDIDTVVDALPSATVLMGVPTHYRRLVEDPRVDRDRVRDMRLFTSGSAPLTPAVFDRFTERTGHRICERYGMSEAGIITSNPYDGPRIAGTVGGPLPGVELRICGDDGTRRPAGAPGTVEVRGPHLFQGYWNRPEATATAHRDGGWFITGDIGSIDDDGRLTLHGRSGDMIISGGENVYPKEVERVLDSVPGVIESAVIGLPHPDLGEGVTAVLVVDATHSVPETQRILREQLARFKHPQATIVADSLPRNTMGKVQKHLLRDRHRDLYESTT